jgi:hypothetical protein
VVVVVVVVLPRRKMVGPVVRVEVPQVAAQFRTG